VMTVHGAKGLEAPIVILPDTGLWKLEHKGKILETDGPPVWRPNKDDMPAALEPAMEAWRDAQRRERRRLLYVAMTRAESWLIACAAGDLGKDDDGWYRTLDNAMDHAGAEAHDFPFGTGKRLRHQDWETGPTLEPDATPETVSDLPEIAPHPPDVPRRDTTLSPSDLGGAKVLPGDPAGQDRDTALARGRLVHMLLEYLPDHPSDMRAQAGKRLIDSDPDALLLPDLQTLVDEAVALLDRPDLAHIFGPEALAEVDITADLDALGGRRIHGAIDRLIVRPDVVLAVDFKTNRLVPDRAEDTPDGLLAQMGAYRDALRQIYPDRRVETAILWTASATLMPLPDAPLDAALATVSVA